MNQNISYGCEEINPSLEGRKHRDPFEPFLNKILIVAPRRGKSFTARLIDITNDGLVFESVSGRKSIYRREIIEYVIEIASEADDA